MEFLRDESLRQSAVPCRAGTVPSSMGCLQKHLAATPMPCGRWAQLRALCHMVKDTKPLRPSARALAQAGPEAPWLLREEYVALPEARGLRVQPRLAP